MVDPTLSSYISEQLKAGVLPEDISQVLISSGWKSQDVQMAMQETNRATPMSLADFPQPTPKKSAFPILIALGSFILLAGGGAYWFTQIRPNSQTNLPVAITAPTPDTASSASSSEAKTAATPSSGVKLVSAFTPLSDTTTPSSWKSLTSTYTTPYYKVFFPSDYSPTEKKNLITYYPEPSVHFSISQTTNKTGGYIFTDPTGYSTAATPYSKVLSSKKLTLAGKEAQILEMQNTNTGDYFIYTEIQYNPAIVILFSAEKITTEAQVAKMATYTDIYQHLIYSFQTP